MMHYVYLVDNTRRLLFSETGYRKIVDRPAPKTDIQFQSLYRNGREVLEYLYQVRSDRLFLDLLQGFSRYLRESNFGAVMKKILHRNLQGDIFATPKVKGKYKQKPVDTTIVDRYKQLRNATFTDKGTREEMRNLENK